MSTTRETIRPLPEGLAMRSPTFFLACGVAQLFVGPSSLGQVMQVHEDCSRDPGWDHYQNRIVGTDMPKVVQDFGWRRTHYTESGPGEIGGGGGEFGGLAPHPR